jgi:DNA-binding PadR family transcriptional regulator
MHKKRTHHSELGQVFGGPSGHRGGPHRHRGGRRPWGDDFGFGPGFGRGGGRRAGRGDVRAAVLVLLEEQPRNGYALMQEIEERSEGVWRPSPGSIYPALQQLEDEGLVGVQEGGSGRTFALTDAGRAHLAEHRGALGEPWKTISGGMPKDAAELGELIRQIAKAAMEVIRSGTPEQRARAVEHLTETRRGLYRILAGDDDR